MFRRKLLSPEPVCCDYCVITNNNNFYCLSPQANNTDRETAAFRRSLWQLLRMEGCRVVSAAILLRP
jgi:hypothetical protein